MTQDRADAARSVIRAALNLDPIRAILGSAEGAIYVPNRKGYLYVRLAASDGTYTNPAIARVGGTFFVSPGAPVILRRDADGALAIVSADFAGQEQAGNDPRANNAADQNIYGYTSQRQLTTLRCQPINGALAVSVKAWVYVDATGQLHEFAGGTIALNAPSLGEHHLAGVFLAGDDTLEVQYSTPRVLADPFDATDVQACLDARTPSAVPICIWRVRGDATNLVDSDLYYDFRQFLNLPQIKHIYSATAAPTSGDDEADGYSIGSLWINVSADTVYICVDNAAGAAVWRQLDAASSGTVTSVGLALPSDTFDITGSPVTGSGTLTGTFKTQLTRYALVAPAGGGTPTWRALETNDISSGTWTVSQGGTGRSSLTANSLLAGNGTGLVNLIAPSTNGNILQSNGTEWQSVAPSFAASVITSGTLALARGGTGADLSATGGANQFVKQTSAGGAFTVAAITSADLTTALTTPPAIGGTTPAAVTATNLSVTTAFAFVRDGAQATMQVDSYLSAVGGTVYALRHARGSVASPSSLLQFDEIGAFNFSGYAGSGFSGLGQVRLIAQAQENFGASAGGSALIIQTTALGSTSAETRTVINPVGIHQMIATDTVNNNITAPGVFSHRTSGTPAVGIGAGVLMQVQTSTTADTDAALISAIWTDVTHASRKARLAFTPIDSGGGREALRLEADGSAARVGFFGATAVVKPTVTGSRGGNAALASLLTALANLGILTDSSSA